MAPKRQAADPDDGHADGAPDDSADGSAGPEEPPPPPPAEDSRAGRNAYERRLWAAVLDAAGGNPELSLEDAKVGLKVVSVGRYSSSEGRACACGQKPLQRVFHLRHEGTGRQLDIGKSCATRFNVLGSLEAQEAERALRNLEQLGEDPESEMEADLRKFARSNGLIVEEESEMIKEDRPQHAHRIAELKAMAIVGFTFVHRTSEEISGSLEAEGAVSNAARQALVRLAVLAERRQLLTIFDTKSLKNEDLDLGKGGPVEKPRQSLVAEAVSRGLIQEARVLLDAVGWSGPHGRAALHQGLISAKDEFVDKYLSRQDSAPPDEVAARLAVQAHKKSLRGMQAIICWCICSGRAAAQAVLDEALREACRVAPETAIQQLLDGGAKAGNSLALLRWCARLGGSGSDEAAEIQDSSSGVRVAEALISKGQARPCLAGRQLERGCLHFAAAAGDAALLELLMRHGSSPWECTFVDSVRPCRELQRGCIQQSERQLPLEVAKASEKDTTKVEQSLRAHMADDLDLACQTVFNPKPSWLEESLQSIRHRLEHGDVDSCGHKVLSMFGKHVDLLRRDPAKAQHEAMERQRQEEDRKRREEEERLLRERRQEEERLAREKAEAEEEDRRRRQEEEARQKREALERKFAEEEARRKERQRRAEAEARQRRAEERRANLAVLLRDGEQKISSGLEAGLTFEEAARANQFFLRRVIDGAPSSEALLCFAKIRIRFVEAEIHHAKENMDSGLDLLHGENMKKEAEWASMRQAEDQAWRVEKKGVTFKDAFDVILRCQDWTLNGKGKYAGKTFESTFRADYDYAQWWIREGPGSNTSFGRFAEARMKVSLSDIQAEEQRRARREAPKSNQQPGRLNEKSFEHNARSKNESPESPSSSEQGDLDRTTALAMVASQGEQCFLRGKHQGSTYLQVASAHPGYVDWWLDKGPGKDNGFGRFADSWRSHKFSPEEIAAAQLIHKNAPEAEPKPSMKRSHAESSLSGSLGAENASEPPAARIRVRSPSPGAAQETLFDGQRGSAMQSSLKITDHFANFMPASPQKGSTFHSLEEKLTKSSIGVDNLTEESSCSDIVQPRSPHSETNQLNREEVVMKLRSEGEQSFLSGKYQGLTYLQVASAHSDYLDWWLDKGPGKENNFGRFADSWRSCKITTQELAAGQQECKNDLGDFDKYPAKRLQPDTKSSADETACHANQLPAKRLRVDYPSLESVATPSKSKLSPAADLSLNSPKRAMRTMSMACAGSFSELPSTDLQVPETRESRSMSVTASSASPQQIPDAGSSDDEGVLLAACAVLDSKIATEYAFASNKEETTSNQGNLSLADGAPSQHSYHATSSTAVQCAGGSLSASSHCLPAATDSHERSTSSAVASCNSEPHSQSSDDESALLAACAIFEHNASAGATILPNQSCGTSSAESIPPASDRGLLLMKLGKHRGRTYEEVLRSDPGWCRWARSQANPSPVLCDFIEYLAAVQP